MISNLSSVSSQAYHSSLKLEKTSQNFILINSSPGSTACSIKKKKKREKHGDPTQEKDQEISHNASVQ